MNDAVVLAESLAARLGMFEPLTSVIVDVLTRKMLGKEMPVGPEPVLVMSAESETLCPTLIPEAGRIVGTAAMRSGVATEVTETGRLHGE